MTSLIGFPHACGIFNRLCYLHLMTYCCVLGKVRFYEKASYINIAGSVSYTGIGQSNVAVSQFPACPGTGVWRDCRNVDGHRRQDDARYPLKQAKIVIWADRSTKPTGVFLFLYFSCNFCDSLASWTSLWLFAILYSWNYVNWECRILRHRFHPILSFFMHSNNFLTRIETVRKCRHNEVTVKCLDAVLAFANTVLIML